MKLHKPLELVQLGFLVTNGSYSDLLAILGLTVPKLFSLDCFVTRSYTGREY